jgi:uncharacterized DUF497 family protein
MGLEFEWDAGKAEANAKKHGVTFAEALMVFADPLARIFDDPDHSANEHREIIIGHSARQLLIVCFAERKGRIRIISARAVTRRERQDYEESKENNEVR